MASIVIGIVGLATGCDGLLHYGPSDPEKMKQFLIEQNIYCPGDDRATILAMIDWSRNNMVHATGSVDDMNWQKVEDLIEESRQAGFMTINGCWGTADFLQQVLGSVNIQIMYDTVKLGGQRHAQIGFPTLDQVAIHGDNVHSWKISKSGTGEVPASEIPVSSAFLGAFQSPDAAIRSHEAEIIKRYMPDVTLWYRLDRYGKFYSAEEIEKDKSGEAGINDVAVDRDVLELVDAEIDRLGGVESARLLLKERMDKPARHTKLVPVPAGKFCKTMTSEASDP